MKKLRLLSLVGITSIALTHAGWAGPHGGGGGGGGGGFSGGGGGRPGGGARGSFGGAPRLGGGAFAAPHLNFGGAVNRGGGVGFAMPRRSSELPYIPNGVPRVQSSVPPRSSVLRSPRSNQTGGLTNAGRVNRTRNNQGRATTALNRPNTGRSPNARAGQTARSTTPRPSNEATMSSQHHIFARESGAQHRDWDQRHAHFFNGHWWCWDGGFWIGLDDGFYPWDFYPYYGYDYYPYDYYTDVEPADQSYA